MKMKNNIPTAEEFLDKENLIKYFNNENPLITDMLIKYAKLHCEAQLKAILENVKVREDELNPSNTEKIEDTLVSVEFEADKGYEDYCPYRYTVDKDSIIKAYDLNQIK